MWFDLFVPFVIHSSTPIHSSFIRLSIHPCIDTITAFASIHVNFSTTNPSISQSFHVMTDSIAISHNTYSLSNG